MPANSLKFSVDSLLLGEIGERLVTKNYIALAELVKNAYDADATEVSISFIGMLGDEAQRQEHEIRIIDNGNGMSFNQVKEFWMRVATPDKLRHTITPRFGRKKTGNKGIGRFACISLGKKLTLETVGKREHGDGLDYTRVLFDWDEYKEGTTLTEIPNQCITERHEKGSTGTTLRLQGLRTGWSEQDFNTLRRQILGLSMASSVKRRGYEEDPGFSISLSAPGFEKGEGKLQEQVMDAGWGRLKGSVSENGAAVLQLEAMKIGKAEFELPERYTEIPGTHFDIAIIWNNKEYSRDRSTLALYAIKDIFKNWSGIKVFLDGFRIYPCGDPGDDWLGIDARQARRLGKIDPTFERICDRLVGVDKSRALLNQPRNQNLVGRVFITNKRGLIFNVPINREGFIDNNAFKRLKEFLVKAIHWATIYYNHFLYIYRSEKMEAAARDFELAIGTTESLARAGASQDEELPRIVDSALYVLDQAFDDYKQKVPSEQRTDAEKHVEPAFNVIRETVLHLGNQVAVLRAIASTGALLFVFSHEAHDVVSRLGTIANSMELISKSASEDKRAEFLRLSKLMKETRNRFNDQMRLLSEVSANISSAEKERIDLNALTQEVIACFSGLTQEFGIITEVSIPSSLYSGPMLRAEAYSILINLLSNAVKATIAGYGHRIRVEALKRDDEISLKVYDDGIGLSPERYDMVLEGLVSDPENRLYKELSKRLNSEDFLFVGKGSGLGLRIVKEILNGYDKYIRFVQVEQPWKTCVEVTLPS